MQSIGGNLVDSPDVSRHVGESGNEAEVASSKPPLDDRLIVKWLENRAQDSQAHVAQTYLNELLLNAAQPRHASGNACIKLCYYLEQCRSSRSSSIRNVAFSAQNVLALFDFYIEWNEKNQNRSVRQVLELVSSLIAGNPDQEVAISIKASILQRALSAIFHKSAQPLVKPAFKSLECFLAKRTIKSGALIDAYVEQHSNTVQDLVGNVWDRFFFQVFDWMILPDVSPAAGKFLVTLFRELRSEPATSIEEGSNHTASWQRWIRAGLAKHPIALENVKNYLFPPLFKLDRPGSIAFLAELNNHDHTAEAAIIESDAHSLLQLAAIEVGKKIGLVEEPSSIRSQKAPKKSSATVLLKEETIGTLLSHSSDTVRSLAFSVMVSSSSSIRPFTPYVFDFLKQNMGLLHSDTDAKLRNEVVSNTKHMIDRLRGSIGFLVREIDNLRSRESLEVAQSQQLRDIEVLLSSHVSFTEWYFKFLLQELVPTASYQRHITALKAIDLLLRSRILKREFASGPVQRADNDTIWPYDIDLFTLSTMRLLLDLLMDPFEDVRSGATAILKSASPTHFNLPPVAKEIGSNAEHMSSVGQAAIEGSTISLSSDVERSLELLMQFIGEGERASKLTGRADYADGVAHSYELLYCLQYSLQGRLKLLTKLVSELEDKVDTAERDLGYAVLEAPVHGSFAAISFVWNAVDFTKDFSVNGAGAQHLQSSLQDIQQRIIFSCLRIWRVVRDILCNDSPEGHLPQELDEVDIIDTKDILSYSFRAIHESSNLMRTMVNKLAGSQTMILPDIFAQVGDLTFDQLSSLRHRGAFSTVSLTFARCCQLTQLLSSVPQGLLRKWYQGALSCIFEQASTTRRSAGIPALLTGIMTASSKDPTFEDVMSKLKSIASQPVQRSDTDQTNLPQVHAMNSLKEIFKSSTLGKRSENHIGECLQIAVDSLESEIWAIRNCGLLLLRSLIDCLFGTSDSKTTIEAGWDGKSIKISYDRYPMLPELLFKLLGSEIISSSVIKPSISTVESVFPALDIIRRAGPPSTHRDGIYELVMRHLGSKVWNVREMAAHAICVLILHDNWVLATKELLEMQSSTINLRHGCLLAVRFIIERQLAMNPRVALEGLPDLAPAFVSSWAYDLESDCPEILTAHQEARNAAGLTILSVIDNEKSLTKFAELKSLLFGSDPYEDFLKSTDGSAPFTTWHSTYIALSRKAVCGSFLTGDTTRLARIFRHSMYFGVDVALAALRFVPRCNIAMSPEALLGLCQAYISTIIDFDSSEVRAVALEGLFDALHSLMKSNIKDFSQILPLLLCLSESFKASGLGSPSLRNSEIQISGWLLVAKIHTSGSDTALVDESLKSWSGIMNAAGKKTEDFNTRFAAVLALDSFYSSLHHLEEPTAMCLVPSHFALYDCLNDDESEIRDVAAKTVSLWLRESLMPLAARKALADSLLKNYGSHPLLAWNVVARITGSLEIAVDSHPNLESAALIFQLALNVNNTLFVEEDQNLFIDEVREVKFWSNILQGLPVNAETKEIEDSGLSPPLSALLSWSEEAIKALNSINKEDGVMGWSSKPLAFSAAMRTLVCAVTLLNYYHENIQDASILLWSGKIANIISELEVFVAKSRNNRVHESLLAEILAIDSQETVIRLGLERQNFSNNLRRI